jgi:CRP-like cAMP-binding protein
MIELELLRQLEPFSSMDKKQLEKLQPKCEIIEFHKGNKLFTEGDKAEHLWVVQDGCVDLRFELPDHRPSSDDMTVDSVSVADKAHESKVLGWSSFVPPYKMRLSAYCVTESCNIVRILKSDLLNLFNADTLMGYRFMSYMIRVVGFRFQQFQDHVAKNMGEDLMFGW